MKQYNSIDALRRAELSMPYLSIENVKDLIEQAYQLGRVDSGVVNVEINGLIVPSEVMKLPTRQARRKK